jgi:hypothetical protein
MHQARFGYPRLILEFSANHDNRIVVPRGCPSQRQRHETRNSAKAIRHSEQYDLCLCPPGGDTRGHRRRRGLRIVPGKLCRSYYFMDVRWRKPGRPKVSAAGTVQNAGCRGYPVSLRSSARHGQGQDPSCPPTETARSPATLLLNLRKTRSYCLIPYRLRAAKRNTVQP